MEIKPAETGIVPEENRLSSHLIFTSKKISTKLEMSQSNVFAEKYDPFWLICSWSPEELGQGHKISENAKSAKVVYFVVSDD